VSRLTIEFFGTNTDSVWPASHAGDNIFNATDTNNPDAMDVDPADATDSDVSYADVFQVPSQGDGMFTTTSDTGEIAVVEPGNGLLMTTNAGEIAADDPSDPPEDHADQTFEFESHFLDTSTVVVDGFPFGNPGAPIPGTTRSQTSYDVFRARVGDSIWAPFKSQRDWDVARWAKTHSTTSTAVDDLLAIPEVSATRSSTHDVHNFGLQVADILGLSFHTVKELNALIDDNLPGRPTFRRKEVLIAGERLEFYCRDALESIRSLFGDPQFANELVFAPERHYTNHERKSRLYHEMYTCDWWWMIQVRVYCFKIILFYY
jgi:hypothetical protein